MKKKTTIYSEHASKYLTVLCRHFSRKVDAVWDEVSGHVTFPMGEARMQVEPSNSALTIYCCADEEEKLQTIMAIIESHVHLFARREPIELVWEP